VPAPAVKPSAPGARSLTPHELANLRDDVLRMLHERPYYVSELGRELTLKYGKPADTLKVDVHVQLKELVGAGVVMRAALEDRWGKKFILYWVRELGEGAFHRALIAHVSALAAEFKIDASGARRNADLVFKVGRAHVAIECESGLKHDLKKFDIEVRRRLRVFPRVWVVVPTEDERQRYAAAVSRANVDVMTLRDLAARLRRGE